MPSPMPRRGLYAITQPSPVLLSQVEAVLQGGVVLLQYRDKLTQCISQRVRLAQQLHQQCQHYGVPLIINDDIELAYRVQAEGIHLGKTDADLALARQRLGTQAIIGVSCYNELERALQAQAAGADYVAFGRFFASITKPEAVLASPALLTLAKTQLTLPIVAIGGITPDNGRQLLLAGADMLAVIGGIFGQPAIKPVMRRYTGLFA